MLNMDPKLPQERNSEKQPKSIEPSKTDNAPSVEELDRLLIEDRPEALELERDKKKREEKKAKNNFRTIYARNKEKFDTAAATIRPLFHRCKASNMHVTNAMLYLAAHHVGVDILKKELEQALKDNPEDKFVNLEVHTSTACTTENCICGTQNNTANEK